MSRAGSVLVVTNQDRAREVAELLDRLGHSVDGATTIQQIGGAERVLVKRPFADLESAQVAARELRDEGWRAVPGPALSGPTARAEDSAWRRHTAPVAIGRDALAVCFPWSVFDRHRFDAVVEIDPGMGAGGFGSGSHPTTNLVLEALAELRLADLGTDGAKVLDVGSGSGVLAVAAIKLGAANAVALDIAPEAVAATEDNARLNDVAGRVSTVSADLARLETPFDVVVANIHAPILVELAADLARLTESWLVVSGLSPAQVSVVSAAIVGASEEGGNSLRLEYEERLDDWAALVFRRAPTI